MNKPTSKVIQISTSHWDQCGRIVLYALCEDGSIWAKFEDYEWNCVLEV